MKILIPTNLSKSSRDAADFAISFFGQHADYCLLNSFPLVYRSGFYDSFHNYTPGLNEIPQEKLKRERKRLLDKYGDQNIQLKALYGDPIEEIFRTAEEKKTDLIVVGNDSYKNWRQGLNYREKNALQDLPYPIVLVPTSVKETKGKSIFYISDFSNKSIEQTLVSLKSIARVSKANVHLYCFETNTLSSTVKDLVNNSLGDVEHTFVTLNNSELSAQNVSAELQNNQNSVVIFDFANTNTNVFESIEKNIVNQLEIKPLLLMPKGDSRNYLKGA